MRHGHGWWLLAPALLLLFIAFILPVGMMVPTSFRPYVPLVGITGGFTARHYVKLVTDSYYLEIIGRTLGLGLIVTGSTLVIGYPVAFFLARTRSRWRSWLTILVVFPLLLNLVVRTFGWIALLAQNGLVNQALQALGVVEEPVKLLFNFAGLLIGLTHIFLPFMVLVLIGAIQNIPRDVEDAARVLGASWGSAFFRVTLPLSAPGHPLGLDPRLRPHHQRAGDPAPARRADLPGDVHADLRRVPPAAQLAGGLRAVAAAHGHGAGAGLPLGPPRAADGAGA